MDKKNILLVTSIVTIAIIGLSIYNLVPNFNTTEFDQESIIKISEGSTTTLNESSPPTTSLELVQESEEINIVENKINELLQFNKAENRIYEFETYLLIGSDERTENSSKQEVL